MGMLPEPPPRLRIIRTIRKMGSKEWILLILRIVRRDMCPELSETPATVVPKGPVDNRSRKLTNHAITLFAGCDTSRRHCDIDHIPHNVALDIAVPKTGAFL